MASGILPLDISVYFHDGKGTMLKSIFSLIGSTSVSHLRYEQAGIRVPFSNGTQTIRRISAAVTVTPSQKPGTKLIETEAGLCELVMLNNVGAMSHEETGIQHTYDFFVLILPSKIELNLEEM